MTFPLARCATCRERAVCTHAGLAKPAYPKCFSPLRRTHIARLEALLDRCVSHDAITHPKVPAMLAALVAQHRVDRDHYSEILEPSFSIDGRLALLRFSYAFPGFRRDPRATALAIDRLVRPFGDATSATVQRLLRVAQMPAVEQPILGLAFGAEGQLRLKTYLQFRDDSSSAAVQIASKLTGCDLSWVTEPLHLLALDHGDQALVGARIYTMLPESLDDRRWHELPRGIDGTPLLAELRDRGVRSLQGALAIHRITGPNEIARQPSEIDFALPQSDLTWASLRTLSSVANLVSTPALDALERDFVLGVRRVSINLGAPRKLTGYYVLVEEEPGSPR